MGQLTFSIDADSLRPTMFRKKRFFAQLAHSAGPNFYILFGRRSRPSVGGESFHAWVLNPGLEE